jgi:NAD(P)-dependent dehydrogenase (short-subunit alcohol dehydrogenase family)
MLGNVGQFNYAGAKAAIAAMTLVAASELSRYGVKVNCLAPVARTRMTLATPGLEDIVKAPDDPDAFDLWNPANIAPLVAYLATADCPFTGGVFHVGGNEVGLYNGFSMPDEHMLVADGRWTVASLQEMAPRLLAEGRDNASAALGPNDLFPMFGRRQPTA